jgi:hypothetical protein
MATVRLTMEIDTDTQPIRGRVHVTGDSATSEFIGWLQLVQTVERVRAGSVTAEELTRSDPHPRY